MSAPACRLYLVAPNILPDDFAARLGQALAAGDVAALRLALHGLPPVAARAAIDLVRPVTEAHDVALIIDGDAALAAASGCDGAHVADPDAAAAARRVLGDLQLGVFCGASRDAAMRAGEAGADYVAFGPFFADDGTQDTEPVSWWSSLMELPVVAEGAIDATNCAALVRAGADFLAVGDAVWNDPAGPGDAVRALSAAIAAA